VTGREFSDEEVRRQAEAFWQYYRRAGLPVLKAFSRWAASKDIGPADLEAIRGEVFEP